MFRYSSFASRFFENVQGNWPAELQNRNDLEVEQLNRTSHAVYVMTPDAHTAIHHQHNQESEFKWILKAQGRSMSQWF